MTTVEQRRSHRVRSAVAVDIIDKRGPRRGTAADVARHGLFVAIPDPPPNRHLVQLVLHLPSGPMQAAASVSRVLPGQGAGLSLFALSTEAKGRWDSYVQQVQHYAQQHGMLPGLPSSSSSSSSSSSALSSSSGSSSPALASPPRPLSIPSFVVKLKTVSRLRDYVTSHVAVGGTVLFTPVLPPAGSSVQLLVVHPETEAEFALGGRVHRAITDAPKRLEIVFVNVDVVAFARFVETGAPPARAMLPSAPPPLVLAPPPVRSPSLDIDVTLDAAAAEANVDDIDIDFDIDDDVSMESEPIEWDLRTSDLPVLLGRMASKPPTVVGEAITTVPTEAKSDGAGDDDDDPFDELIIDDTVAAADPGLAPTAFELRCSDCDAGAYVVELGPCAGVLGLVADQTPFWSAETGRVVSIPRLVTDDVRRDRFARFTGRGGAIDDVVNIATFLAAADLAEAPRHPQSGATLRSSRAVDRLKQTASHAVDDGAAHETRIRCPSCAQGHLVLSLQGK